MSDLMTIEKLLFLFVAVPLLKVNASGAQTLKWNEILHRHQQAFPMPLTRKKSNDILNGK